MPSKGTEVYKVFWDTSTLAIPVDESKLRVIVCRNDKNNVNALKWACILFDEEYPNGAPPGVLSINSTQLGKKKSSSANRQPSNYPSIQQVLPAISHHPTEVWQISGWHQFWTMEALMDLIPRKEMLEYNPLNQMMNLMWRYSIQKKKRLERMTLKTILIDTWHWIIDYMDI